MLLVWAALPFCTRVLRAKALSEKREAEAEAIKENYAAFAASGGSYDTISWQ